MSLQVRASSRSPLQVNITEAGCSSAVDRALWHLSHLGLLVADRDGLQVRTGAG